MKRDTLTAVVAYLAISVFIFRETLASPGSIGLLHDWCFPIYSEQLGLALVSSLSSWNPGNLGLYSANNLALYGFLLQGSRLLPPSLFLKLSLVFLFFISGISAYWLCRHTVRSSQTASFMAGLFYMLSPVVFTRVIVGYYFYIIGYSLIPLVLYGFLEGVEKRSYLHLLLCGLLFGISTFQIQFGFMIPLVLLAYALSDRKNAQRAIGSFFFVIGVFCLVQLPMVYYSFSDILRGAQGLSTTAGSTKFFWLYFFATPLAKALLLFGKDYEFLFLLYFQNRYLFLPFLVSAVSIPVLAFSAFRFPKARFYVFLTAAALFLMKGPNPPLGWLYQWLYDNVPLSSIFRTSYHWSVLVALGYAMLLAISYDGLKSTLEDREKLGRWLKDLSLVLAVMLVIYTSFALDSLSSLSSSFAKRGIPEASIYIIPPLVFAVLLLFYFRADGPASRISEICKKGGTPYYRHALLFLIFLAMILVYSWPVLTGDFDGRLQLYQYDEKYHSLFKNLQDQQEGFRVLWLPMVQPMTYKNSTYSGHDVLIGYSPKPTFDQDLALFSDGSRYTAFLANLVNSNSTEYMGDILNYTSTKYIIYRNDFESVLPEYLPFGSVKGFNWSKEAPLNFLRKQKDLRLKDSDGDIYTFQNDFEPRFSAQPPVLVAGSLSTMISLSYAKDLLGLKKLPALLYLEEMDSKDCWNLSDTAVLDGDSYMDAVTSFLDARYKFDAGWYARDLDARAGWTNTFSWWWYDPFATSQMEYGALSLGGNSSLNLHTNLPPGEYRVLVKARCGPGGSRLSFASDGQTAVLDTSNRTESYRWSDLGLFNLTDDNIAIKGTGKNVVQRLLVVPETNLISAYSDASRRLRNCSIVLLYELERSDAENATACFGSSQGYLDLSPSRPISLNIYVPKEDTYELNLRASSNESAEMEISIDGNSHQKRLPSEFVWLSFGYFNLSQGYHHLELKGDGLSRADLLVLRSKSTRLHDFTGKINYAESTAFGQIDPTKYTIQVKAKEPFLLTFGENYHPAWVLRDAAGHTFNHYKVNGYANGYWISGSNNTSYLVEFSKQKAYGITLFISLMTFVIIVFIIIWRSFI